MRSLFSSHLSNNTAAKNPAQGYAVLAATVWLLVLASGISAAVWLVQQQRAPDTLQALASAKRALLDYAASQALTDLSANVGTLPCPAASAHASAAASCSASKRLGWLPDRTLGLAPLKDASGSGLWYATGLTNLRPSAGGLRGPLTLSGLGDNHNAANGEGVVAVILAPHRPLKRADGLQQQRQSNDDLSRASHYLDNISATEDNADFLDNTSNGFVQASASAQFNDAVLSISTTELERAVARRVLFEVAACLTTYAATEGRLPYAASLSQSLGSSTNPRQLSETNGLRFGRVPTELGLGSSRTYWSQVSNCKLNSYGGWAPYWREWLFYAVAPSYTRDSASLPSACDARSCLLVNGQWARAALVFGGKVVSGQSRSNTTQITQYVEQKNSLGVEFENCSHTACNDVVMAVK